jgi:YVTN family beta-propeller protein
MTWPPRTIFAVFSRGPARHPRAGGFFVTNEGSNDVSVVDLTSRTVTATIAVGNVPRKIAVQPTSGPAATTPAPERAATAPVRGHDHEGLSPPRPDSRQPDPEEAISSA